jgi:hypothetical protein
VWVVRALVPPFPQFVFLQEWSQKDKREASAAASFFCTTIFFCTIILVLQDGSQRDKLEAVGYNIFFTTEEKKTAV